MKEKINTCYEKIKPYVHLTPIMESGHIENFLGSDLYFKCENFQRAGAFKMRGATHAILNLSADQKAKGVVTHSSGNFAQALALAARTFDVKCYIVMPFNAPIVKKDAVVMYGGEIVECAPTMESRERVCNQVIDETGATFIHPSNEMDVILGSSTATKELLEAKPDLDALIVPVGGGGLLAGTILAAKAFGKAGIEVYAGEPYEVDDAFRSLESGKIECNLSVETIADGLRTQLGDVNFPIIQEGVKAIIRVRENEIISAMRLIWQRMKIIVEPSSAVALAVLIKERQLFEGKKVGIILSGGNVDLDNLPFE
ncbi:pyridoxal-phosphate dependent enzyme [Myroides sp. DF42-4-2]|uniref:pyridoxal-phosphate dependent enzyme n=1 Tax=unclassified Myroides TaxID=2642485 RepID=UPI002577A231|nr:pyridoxal-phosphate dependent enzyme [Myroides sp. DF42-4-2]MDM1408003.1 pyridoxal-phosphate dependent enzyme [Myroides sp. DF42-4-2]